MMRSKGFRRIITVIILSALALSIYAISDYILTYKWDNVAKEQTILIPADANTRDLFRIIEESGALKNFQRFKEAADKMELASKYKSGRYLLKKGMNNTYIVNTITHKWEQPVRLVISGRIRNMETLATVLSRNMNADSAAFATLLKDSSIFDSLGFTKETFPAMFIPNTYEVYWSATPKTIINRLHKEYQKFWTQERLDKANEIGLTPNEVSTLASIVDEESNYKPELSTIAGVYMNRLNRKERLGADPTVIYALSLRDTATIKRVLKKDLKIDSPYNTYKYKGLPPGPIRIPSIAAIDAVLSYEKHDYFFFCGRPEMDGLHNFAVTHEEHLRNARKFQKALNEKKIYR